jgi:hypothetical protein
MSFLMVLSPLRRKTVTGGGSMDIEKKAQVLEEQLMNVTTRLDNLWEVSKPFIFTNIFYLET